MPEQTNPQPLPANPNAVLANTSLALASQSFSIEEGVALLDAGTVHAQLAVAYELNTIGRILAYNSDILAPVNNAGKQTSALQHNAIVERLGL
jgi:hypothetical protein